MSLTHRQREILHEMGIPLWVRRRHNPAEAMDSLPQTPPVPENTPQPEDRVPGGLPAATPPLVAGLDWEALRTRVAGCVACSGLATRRTQTVFGVGDPNADWLFIGEAPGAEEDRRGEPFVGRAGQLLDNMLAALGLARGENVYIANILKCRPPGNRDPLPEEVTACRPFLDRQIALIAPRVVVALGRVAAQAVLDTDAPLGRLRGEDHDCAGIPLVVTYHPAYLLRSPADKTKAWTDLLRARTLMLRP